MQSAEGLQLNMYKIYYFMVILKATIIQHLDFANNPVITKLTFQPFQANTCIIVHVLGCRL